MTASVPALCLAQSPPADELLARDPFALLVGMLLDQRIPMEKAFAGPQLLAQRLGVDRLEPARIAGWDPQLLVEAMTGPPAVHRFPKAMAERLQALAGHVAERYGADASALWTGAADGPELLSRLKALPGYGDQKARIFTALLGKQLGVRPAGWEKAAGEYAEPGYRSVADVVDAQSLQLVREYKQARRAAGG